MRAMPGLRVIRPADANETAHAWRIAVDSDGPTALILSRQNVPVSRARPTPPTAWPAAATCWSTTEGGPAEVVLVGTGSEVQLCVDAAGAPGPPTAAMRCGPGGVAAVVGAVRAPGRGVPDEVLPPGVPTLAVEAAGSFGWERYADDSIAIDHFGASAPGAGGTGAFRVHPHAPTENVPVRPVPRAPVRSRCRRGSQKGVIMTELNDLYDQQGQSPWLDNLRRDYLPAESSGLVDEGIRGVTSNPTIFAKAIEGEDRLRRAVRRRCSRPTASRMPTGSW